VKQEEAEKTLSDYVEALTIYMFSRANNNKEELDRAREKVLIAMTLEPTAPMSFEEFVDKAYDAVYGDSIGRGNSELRSLYDRMRHAATEAVENGISFDAFTSALGCRRERKGEQCKPQDCSAFVELRAGEVKP